MSNTNLIESESPSIIMPEALSVTPIPSLLGSKASPTSAAADSFTDLNQLRLNQDFVGMVGTAKPIGKIPLRKPSKESFIRVHPADEFRILTNVIELKEDRETYFVVPKLWPDLISEPTFAPLLLVTAMSRPGNVPFVWPLRVPNGDKPLDDWGQSALNIALNLATQSWVRVTSSRSLDAYEAAIAPASAAWGDPTWPGISFQEILRIAFKERVIDHLDHPVLRRLRGES